MTVAWPPAAGFRDRLAPHRNQPDAMGAGAQPCWFFPWPRTPLNSAQHAVLGLAVRSPGPALPPVASNVHALLAEYIPH
jgi:hypothetical protein